MKKYVHIGICLSICVPFCVAHAHTFYRTLSEGMSGPDVLQLQKVLNSNPLTRVSPDGLGSPGNETDFFGPRTKQAVVAFQNLNAPTILTPLGLSAGTGFVGASTLAFLNTLEGAGGTMSTTSSQPFPTPSQPLFIETPAFQTQLQPQTQIQTQPQFTQTQTPSQPPVNNMQAAFQFFIHPTTLQAGEKTFVGSEHDLTKAQFSIGGVPFTQTCHTNYTCEITIPKTFTPGTYALSITNPAIGSHNITVMQPSGLKPETSITTLSLTKDNLISGKNFTQTMKITTSFGTFVTQTLNNQFILAFPAGTTAPAATSGILILENENGTRSDILLVQYEK